jgi:hypothetical protein
VNGQAPGVIASFSGQRLGPLPVYASINADAAKALYEQRFGTTVQDFGLGKVDLLPSLRAPLSSLPFLSVNASIGYRVTYFTESLDPATRRQIEESVTRRYADMRAEVVGPVFTRVFNPNNAFADRAKHIVEPAFTVQRITSIDNQNRIPTTASYEYRRRRDADHHGVTNRLLAWRGGGGAEGAAKARPRDVRRATGGAERRHQPELLLGRDREPLRQLMLLLFQRPPSNYSAVSLVARRCRPTGRGGLPHGDDLIAIERRLVATV